MKKAFIILVLLTFGFAIKAQEIPQKQIEEWATLIEEGEIELNDKGLAIVWWDSGYDLKYGLVDSEGILVTPLKYDDINEDEFYDSSTGTTVVYAENKYGLIDAKGKEITPIKYSELWFDGFYDPPYLAMVKSNGKLGYINIKGHEVLPTKYLEIEEFQPVNPEKESDSWKMKNCLAYVSVKDSAGYKAGYVNIKGKEVIPVKYEGLSWGFSEGLVAGTLNGKSGFLNKRGKVVIPFKYESASNFSEGLAPVKTDNKWGFIDKKGEFVIPSEYDEVTSFIDGLARVNVGDLWGAINQSGEELTPIKYNSIEEFNEGIAAVEVDGKWGLINNSGEEITPIKYDVIIGFGQHIEGFALVNIGGELYKGDAQNIHFSTGKFNDTQGGKFGLVDSTGKEIVPPKYDDFRDFREGLAGVKLNEKFGFINKKGEEVIPLKYDWIILGFSDGRAQVELNGETFYIDKKGNKVE